METQRPWPDSPRTERFFKELESDHRSIRDLFNELKPVILSRKIEDMPSFKKKLEELEGALLGHLEREDDEFYGSLKDKALGKKQDALVLAIELYRDSMHEVSKKTTAFFEDYRDESEITADTEGFFPALKDLRYEILKRISREEGGLFHIYRTCFLD